MEYQKLEGTIKDLRVGDLFVNNRRGNEHDDWSLRNTHTVTSISPFEHIRTSETDMVSPRRYITKAGIFDTILIWRPIVDELTPEMTMWDVVNSALLDINGCSNGVSHIMFKLEDAGFVKLAQRNKGIADVVKEEVEKHRQTAADAFEDGVMAAFELVNRERTTKSIAELGSAREALHDICDAITHIRNPHKGVNRLTAARLCIPLGTELTDILDGPDQVIPYSEGNAPTYTTLPKVFRYVVQFTDGTYDEALGTSCVINSSNGDLKVFASPDDEDKDEACFHVVSGTWRSVRDIRMDPF